MARIVVIAGEASGDLLAAGLIRELRRRYPELSFEGITGPAMRSVGCISWGGIEQLSVMGLFEVIRHLPRIYRLKRDIQKRLRTNPPDLLIGVDAPDFNLRIAAFARSQGIRTIQYVCPSVWAWRSGRVKTIKKACDHVLCVLPFEPEFLARHGINASFVGHPLADEIDGHMEQAGARRNLGISGQSVVALLPGSRRAEIEQLGPPFLQASQWITARLPDTSFMLAAASPAMAKLAQQQCIAAGLADSIRIVTGRTREVIAAADVVLLASGTATLETMLMLRPMVVAYRASALTAWVLRRPGLVKIRRFSLPNLLAGEDLVAELIQEQVSAESVAQAVQQLLTTAALRDRMLARFRELSGELRCSANERAAAVVADILNAVAGKTTA